ncbi:Transposase_IS4 [Hexamita inflata]|uniref:Transposase_IS4 n=1 Tax=Hexamita inflata TaxID=28002 RepID=A0ABP1HLH7_9EUKA
MKNQTELDFYELMLPDCFKDQLKEITNYNMNVLFPKNKQYFLSGEWECYQAAILALFCTGSTNLKKIWDYPDFYGVPFVQEMFNYEDMKNFIESYSVQYRKPKQYELRELLQPSECEEEEEEEEYETDQVLFNDPVILPEQFPVIRGRKITEAVWTTTEIVDRFINAVRAKFLELKQFAKNLSMDELVSASKSRCIHNVLIRGKPHPKGHKHFCVCDAKTGFCFNFFMHYSWVTDDKLSIFKKLLDIFEPGQVTITADNFFFSEQSMKYCTDQINIQINIDYLGSKRRVNNTTQLLTCKKQQTYQLCTHISARSIIIQRESCSNV